MDICGDYIILYGHGEFNYMDMGEFILTDIGGIS